MIHMSKKKLKTYYLKSGKNFRSITHLTPYADPVFQYLRDMEKTKLLTKESEIEIAQRIERAKNCIVKNISKTQLIVGDLLFLEEKADDKDKIIKEIFEINRNGISEKTYNEDKEQIFEKIREIKRLLRKFDEIPRSKKYRIPRKRLLVEASRHIRELDFHPKYQNKIFKRLQEKLKFLKKQEKIKEVLNDNLRGTHGKTKKIELRQEINRINRLMRATKGEVGMNSQDLHRTLRKISAEKKQYEKAKNELVTANLRLVIAVAKKYANRGVRFADLIQEGNIGLIKAADKFEYQRGCKFSTYATWWIKQAVSRSLHDQARTIRIPVHMVETINRAIRVTRELVQEKGREPTCGELAEKMNMSVKKVRKIKKITLQPVSLDTPVGEEQYSTLKDFIKDNHAPPPPDVFINDNLRNRIESVLNTVSEREARVLRTRFGIGSGNDHTLEELGQQFKVTRERIRQIESKALKKLRSPRRIDELKSFFDS